MKTLQEEVGFLNTFLYKLPIEQMECIINLLSPEARQEVINVVQKEFKDGMEAIAHEYDGHDFEETEFGTQTY